MKALEFVCRLLFGGLFLYSAWEKLLDPPLFAQFVVNYKLLPDAAVNLVALFLPWLEVVCGLALIVNVLPLGALAILNGMMTVFMAALAFNLSRGLDVACGCFSLKADSGGAMQALIRDGFILAFGLLTLWLFWRRTGSKVQP